MKQLLCIALFICIVTSQSFSQSTTLSKFVALSVPDDAKWNPDTLNLNANGTVYAIGKSDYEYSCYIGGHFDRIGGIAAKNLAFFDDGYDTKTFSEVGGGVKGGEVRTIVRLHNEELYIGGSFTQVGDSMVSSVAHRKDSLWETMDGGVDGTVYTLAIVGNLVYAGGAFSHAGSVEAHNIATYSILTKKWSPVMDKVENGVNDTVRAMMLMEDGTLYVGGKFTKAGTVSVGKIASYKNSTWTDLNGGTMDSDGFIATISSSNSNVFFVGGKFNTIGNKPIHNIALFSDNTWNDVFGRSVDGPVYAINDFLRLVVGGDFHKCGDSSCNYIASIDDFNPVMGSGLDGPCYALAGRFLFLNFQNYLNNHLYVGGQFNNAGSKPSKNFGVWGEHSGSVATKNSIVKSIIITPNPTQTSASIQFSLLQRANVSIAIIDALGRNVASFGSLTYEEGAHSIALDCKEFPHGMLFARITSASGETVTAKFIRE